MTGLLFALLVGFVGGFLGAVPPGPLNVTIIRESSRGNLRQAFRVALGGALTDMAVCAAVMFGLAWALERLTTNFWVKVTLAIFLVACGLKILIIDRRREEDEAEASADQPRSMLGLVAAPHLPALPSLPALPQIAKARSHASRFPFLVGVLQGAANPALFVNWTFFIGFLVGHGYLKSGAIAGAGFSIGIGLGVFAWFALLIEIVDHIRNRPTGLWIHKSTVFAGLFLVGFGLFFTWKTLQETSAPRPDPASIRPLSPRTAP